MQVRVSISFREEIVGDEAGSKSFYVKLTPRIKTRSIVTPQDILKDLGPKLNRHIKAKGVIQ